MSQFSLNIFVSNHSRFEPGNKSDNSDFKTKKTKRIKMWLLTGQANRQIMKARGSILTGGQAIFSARPPLSHAEQHNIK